MITTDEPIPQQSMAFAWMDAARLLAAVMVCASHVRNLLLADYQSSISPLAAAFYFVTGLGDAAVILFFVLSGFWIARTVARRAGQHNFMSTYLVARLSRLWLVAIPAVLLTGAIDWVGIVLLDSQVYAGTVAPSLFAGPVQDSLTTASLLGNFVFLQALAVPAFGSNGPLWSLAYEFWYYLVFPALWLLLRHGRPTWLLLAVPVLAVDLQLMLGFVVWMIGAGLYAIEATVGRSLPPRLARIMVLPVSTAFCAALAWHRFGKLPLFDPVLALTFALLLLCLLRSNLPLPSLARPIARLGAQSSFSIYAIHMPIAVFVAALVLPDKRFDPNSATMLLVLGVTAALVAAGYVFSRFTEAQTPALRLWLTRTPIMSRSGKGRP